MLFFQQLEKYEVYVKNVWNSQERVKEEEEAVLPSYLPLANEEIQEIFEYKSRLLTLHSCQHQSSLPYIPSIHPYLNARTTTPFIILPYSPETPLFC